MSLPMKNIFSAFDLHFLKSGIGKGRLDLLKKQASRNGASVCEDLATFVETKSVDKKNILIVEDSLTFEDVKKIVNRRSNLFSTFHQLEFEIVSTKWLSHSLRSRRAIDRKEYRISGWDPHDTLSALTTPPRQLQTAIMPSTPIKTSAQFDQAPPPKIPKFSLVAEERIENEAVSKDKTEASESSLDDASSNATQPILPRGNWVCLPSKPRGENKNDFVISKLEEMCDVYKSTKDQWRALSYRKAITALKNSPNEITSYAEAVALTGVGVSIAEKIAEIIESGKLRKLESLKGDEKIQTIELFTRIWGVGPTHAEAFYNSGCKSLEDIRLKAKLTRQQQIGLKHFDDLESRMPWSEASEIEQIVKEVAIFIQEGLIVEGCGSFRRKRDTCGDIDILITHPDGSSHVGVFSRLLHRLKDTGFLTDDLVSDETNGNQKKYLGVCRLPPIEAQPDRKHRRIDIIVVPFHEWACARLYFTGSAIFNRSMRALAIKKGMSLTEHSLNVGVVRDQGVKIHGGTPLETPTEQSVFEHLGIPYLPPEERERGK